MRKSTESKVQLITEPDSYAVHAKKAADKLDLKGLDLRERAFLGTCQDIYRNSRGTATPFENFITTVIRWATWGNPPTPESLIEELKTETEDDFEITLHSVKRFTHNYPDLVRELQTAEELLVATQPATKTPANGKTARKAKRKAA